MRYFILFFVLAGIISLNSCSENPQNVVSEKQELLYQKQGLVDSLVGTCSSYLVRNFVLDSIDFNGYTKGIFEKDAFTDGDLSEIIVYYLNADTAVNIVNLEGQSQINSVNYIEFYPSNNKRLFYLRLKLFSSVCTGQLYHLKLRNINVYGTN
mgnify:FL=1